MVEADRLAKLRAEMDVVHFALYLVGFIHSRKMNFESFYVILSLSYKLHCSHLP